MLKELLSLYTCYPFNLNTDEKIDTITVSNNINIKIYNNVNSSGIIHTEISSESPVFIKFDKNILYVWNTIADPDIKEESYYGDYRYEDYEGYVYSPIVFMYHVWYILEIKELNLIIKGDNNQIMLNIPASVINEGDNNVIN
jgi:hypothetical protein